jgi:hypothetical protein
MAFDEAGDDKCVLCVSFEGREARVEEIAVEKFRRFVRIEGDATDVLEALAAVGEDAWVEVRLSDDNPAAVLDKIYETAADAGSEVLAVKIVSKGAHSETTEWEETDLKEMDALAVFRMLLARKPVEDETLEEALVSAYETIYAEVVRNENREDQNA